MYCKSFLSISPSKTGFLVLDLVILMAGRYLRITLFPDFSGEYLETVIDCPLKLPFFQNLLSNDFKDKC